MASSEVRTPVTIASLLASGVIIGHKDGNYGSFYPRASEFGAEGVPFLTAKSLENGRIDIDGAPRLSEQRADALPFGFVQPEDVLLSHNATVGRVAVVPEFSGRLLVGTSLTYFRVNKTKLSPRYLAAYFVSSDFQQQLAAVMSHSTRNQVPVTAQRNLKIVVPPMSEQVAVANILGMLEAKIELYRLMSKALQELAQTVFKSWFVDFDPVRAKAEGREPEGMDAATAALFPGEFQESTLGEIPKEWNISAFDDAVTVTSGGTPKTARSDYWGGDIPWFSIVDAPGAADVFVINTEKSITPDGLASCSARLLPVGATIISARGTVGKLAVTGVPMAINQSCYALLPNLLGSFGTFFQTERLVDVLKQRAHGAVFSTITRDTLSSVSVIVPPPALAAAYEEQVEALMQRILTNRKTAKTLTELRDSLLPRLISGKLRLQETERLMEAAL